MEFSAVDQDKKSIFKIFLSIKTFFYLWGGGKKKRGSLREQSFPGKKRWFRKNSRKRYS